MIPKNHHISDFGRNEADIQEEGYSVIPGLTQEFERIALTHQEVTQIANNLYEHIEPITSVQMTVTGDKNRLSIRFRFTQKRHCDPAVHFHSANQNVFIEIKLCMMNRHPTIASNA